MRDLSAVTTGDRHRALGISTLAFTVSFAVWTIFSIIGIKIKQDLGLNDTQFVNHSEVQLGCRLRQERSLT